MNTKGLVAGYFSREAAIEYREIFQLMTAHDHLGTCRARLFGGGDRPSVGVWLNLRDSETLLAALNENYREQPA